MARKLTASKIPAAGAPDEDEISNAQPARAVDYPNHPPAARTGTSSARTKSWSAIKPASATAAGTRAGTAARATPRCTVSRSTPTRARSTGLQLCASRPRPSQTSNRCVRPATPCRMTGRSRFAAGGLGSRLTGRCQEPAQRAFANSSAAPDLTRRRRRAAP